jgi:hypothetical protein
MITLAFEEGKLLRIGSRVVVYQARLRCKESISIQAAHIMQSPPPSVVSSEIHFSFS